MAWPLRPRHCHSSVCPVAAADVSSPDGPLPAPRVRLVGYQRQRISAGSCAPVSWTLTPPAWMAAAELDGSLWTQSGRVVFSVGGGQPGFGDPQAVLQSTSFFGSPQPLAACGDLLEMQKVFFGGSAGVTLPV